MVVAHVNKIRHKPGIENEREHEQPTFVPQDEGPRSAEDRCSQFAENHRQPILKRGLEIQFAEGEMVKQHSLRKNEYSE